MSEDKRRELEALASGQLPQTFLVHLTEEEMKAAEFFGNLARFGQQACLTLGLAGGAREENRKLRERVLALESDLRTSQGRAAEYAQKLDAAEAELGRRQGVIDGHREEMAEVRRQHGDAINEAIRLQARVDELEFAKLQAEDEKATMVSDIARMLAKHGDRNKVKAVVDAA